MPDDKSPDSSKSPDTKTKGPVKAGTIADATPGGIVGVTGAPDLPTPAAPGSGGTLAPMGGITLDVGTDITTQLNQAIPAFGNVLTAIGNGVASSQKALDQSVITTVNTLNTTNIDVLTDV